MSPFSTETASEEPSEMGTHYEATATRTKSAPPDRGLLCIRCPLFVRIVGLEYRPLLYTIGP